MFTTMTIPSALLLVALSSGAFAQSKNATEEDKVEWVPPDSSRDTWEIIWSCLSIFIVCSWKCVHLNVPTHRESMAGWNRIGGIFYVPSGLLLQRWTRKVTWMFIIAIAPELGVSQAVRQWREAKEELIRVSWAGRNRPHNAAPIRGQRFTLTHAFYVRMGGILLCEIPEGDPALVAPAATETNPFEDPSEQRELPPVHDSDYILLRDQVIASGRYHQDVRKEDSALRSKVTMKAQIISSLGKRVY